MAREPVPVETSLETADAGSLTPWIVNGRIRLPQPGWTVDQNGGRRGRKPGLTDQMAQRIVLAILNGQHQGHAAEFAGITSETMSRWMNNPEEPYVTFQQAVRHAEAVIAGKAVKVVMDSKDAKDQLEFLARRFPKRWQKPAALAVNNNIAIMDLGSMLDRIEQKRSDPSAPRDPRPPRKIAVASEVVVEVESEVVVEDAEIVDRPKREPVPVG